MLNLKFIGTFCIFFASVKALCGVPEMSCTDLKSNLSHWKIVDVRTTEEFSGELGHISGSELVTLGPDLTRFLKSQSKDQKIVFVCRSGSRSLKAVSEAIQLGFKKTASMKGGMLEWNRLGYPTER